MFSVRNMSRGDFAFAVSLTETMGWGLDEEDFEFMRRLEPKGCFVLLRNSERIGVVTTLCFNHVGWLGNLIVNDQYRKKGIGTMLATHAIAYLVDKGVKTIGLYSYMDKVSFYEKLGFKSDSKFVVLRGRGFASTNNPLLKRATKSNIRRIVEYDASCLGFSRVKLLKAILTNTDNLCYMCFENDELQGYGIAKVYNGTAEVGPLVCHQGRNQVAIEILNTIVNRLKDFEIFMCIAERQKKLVDILVGHGFRVGFPVTRMFRGEPIDKGFVYIAESLERG